MQRDTYTAFVGHQRLATGTLEDVVRQAKARVDAKEPQRIALFQDDTGRTLDIDYRGDERSVLARLADHPLVRSKVDAATAPSPAPERKGPGRPKLGVVSREISLLPRHWDWLASQGRGASATLRALVDEARRERRGADEARQAQEAAHRFLWEMAGDLPDFEAATRALYANDAGRMHACMASWPPDIRDYAVRLVGWIGAKTRRSSS